MREIIITIAGGKTTVETKGFSGSECLAETAELEKALGKVSETKATPEMRMRPSVASVKATGGR